MLLQTEDRQSWYEVEVQLGATDESHIIRTIEYWDIERKRYPDISHTAVIVAEEITSRFFNVISLFNQSVPIVAIKLTALTLGEKSTLLFTKVLDYVPKGLEEARETVQLSDRPRWERKSNPLTLAYVDALLSGAKALDASVCPKYNQNYIGTQVAGLTSNFATFKPQSRALRVSVHIASSNEVNDDLNTRGIDWDYDSGRYKHYRIWVPAADFNTHSSFLTDLITRAFKEVEMTPGP